MHHESRLLTGAFAAGFVATAVLATAPEADWSARTAADARAFHAEQADSHPGPVNPADPGFAARLDGAREKALRRAALVSTPGGYLATLREMVASFNDGHMYVGFGENLPVTGNWPGFITAWRDGELIVTYAQPGMQAPATGDRVIVCDGRPPTVLGAELVAPWQGSWALAAQREQQGWRVFFDQSNPFTRRPEICRFATSSGPRDVALSWRPEPKGFRATVTRVNSAARAPFAVRRFGDGLWVSAGSFAGDGRPADKALPALVKHLAAEGQLARTAPVLVLDLRGNSGGSSDWGVQMARIVWGEAPVARLRITKGANVHVDWRPSSRNVATLAEFCTPLLEKPNDASADVVRWCKASLDGMKAANAKNAPLWREPDDPAAAPPAATPPLRTRPTFVLVDGACGSACLDTVDLWTGIGAKVIGRTTSADSNYMEVRSAALPSGLGEFSVPMKVYSGRPRGSGVPVEPLHHFDGDMGDTAALEAWVATLPR
jgi:hypothetical protein